MVIDTNIRMEDLYVGARIKIKDNWCSPHFENGEGRMDCYLGKVVTISRIGVGDGKFFNIFEDSNWSFWPEIVESIIEDDNMMRDCHSDSDILTFIMSKEV